MWTIRRATVEDVETLTDLRLQFLEEVSNSGEGLEVALAEYFRRKLLSETYVAWLAHHDGAPIGTAGFVFLDKPPSGKNPGGREAYVMNVYTLSSWRKKGIASALLESVLQGAKEAGVGWMRLHSTEDGDALYRHRGFVATANEKVLRLE